MKHTKESIIGLLNRNDEAVCRALRTVKAQNGFCFGGYKFGCSLIEQLDQGKRLSQRQLAVARQILAAYAAVLARVANEAEVEVEEEELACVDW